ncbi:MAG: DNA primase [Bacteroidetes bacterium HGW-Bacteroidetes-16]|jgi:putative DNA primase/helicase|nr:MAG: DNA primase [Bacteroidetes bacterium HGW-Bacteroidetes-16]
MENNTTILIPTSSQKVNSTRDIFNKLLSQVSPLDMHKSLGLSDEQQILKRQKIVLVVDNVIEIAKKSNYGLCQHNNQPYLFNGSYWIHLEEKLHSLLGEAACKMGIDENETRHHEFRSSLIKQFESIAIQQLPIFGRKEIFINLLNGTLVIKSTGAHLKAFDSKDFITYQLPFSYTENATAQAFTKFLDRVLPDEKMQDILSEYIGYLFIPNSEMKLEKVLLLVGEGANGKSTFFDIINGLLGRENISTYSMSKLTDINGYYRAMIGDKLVNYASEISPNMDTTVFKQLVSGEPVEARLPYGKPLLMENYARFIFNTNELPKDVEHNNAFFRRFLIIPFDITIPEEEQDKSLAQKIVSSELPGVLNWALKGLDRIIAQQKFTHSEKVNEIISRFRQEADTVHTFIEETGYIATTEVWTPLKQLFDEYKGYCHDNLYRPVGNKTFKKRLNHLEFYSRKSNQGQMLNITLPETLNNIRITLKSLE